MIQEFINTWPLFAESHLTGWLVAVILAIMGVFVVARDQIFIGAAVAQASTLGIALGMVLTPLLFHIDEADHLHAADMSHQVLAMSFAVVFAIIAAVITSRPTRPGRESTEAMTGWVFLLSSALTVLIVANSPFGMEEVQRLMASSLIGSNWTDVYIYFGLLTITIIVILCKSRTLLTVVLDPQMASAAGVSTASWSLLINTWLGLCLGLTMHTTGLLYAFGCLILPALIAKALCRRVRSMLIVSPVIALIIAVCSFVPAIQYDLPPAQLTIAVAGLLLPLAWGVRRLRCR